MKRDKIREMYKACSKEITSRTNDIQHLLLGEGDFDAKVMIIADVPSVKEEDANQNLLDSEREKLLQVLEPLDMSIDDVYMSHLMKYRPYKFNTKGHIVSRKPTEEEYSFFMPYLEKEISLIGPKLIITLGDEPLRRLAKDKTIKVDPSDDQLLVVGVHGKSYKLYPIYHPKDKKIASSIERFNNIDVTRLSEILHGGQINDELLHEIKKSLTESMPKADVTKETEGVKDSTMVQKTESEDVKTRLFEKIVPTGSQKTKKKRSYITMIYGGEGFVDDPVLVGLERMSRVFTELEIGIHRIDLHKGKVSMAKAFEYISESKGVVLGVCVEWFGIGYRMQQFLDECFFHGDKSYFDKVPLLGMALTRQGFEKEAYIQLLKSWQCLGGREGLSIEGVVKTAAELETNFDWLYGIDKKAEQFYRIMQQDKGLLPYSYGIERIEVKIPIEDKLVRSSDLEKSRTITKETQPIKDSVIIEDYDTFVEKQQQDIQSISSLFKKKLSSQKNVNVKELPQIIMEAYQEAEDVNGTIQILFDDTPRENTVIELNGKRIRSYFGQKGNVELSISSTKEIFGKIFAGKLTMQRAFMTGEVKAKGDFTLIYKFEEYFKFS